jgi:hypothetical protein
MIPTRQIMSVMDIGKWKKSKAYTEYLNFVRNLNDSVRNTKLSNQVPVSPVNFLTEFLNVGFYYLKIIYKIKGC